MSRASRFHLATVCVALALYAALVWRFDFLCDDAFISFRYARNAAEGLGLRYNLAAGDPVEGYSNFLWTVCLAVAHRLGLDMLFVSRLTSAASGALLLVLLIRHARRRPELGASGAAATAMFAATLPPLLVWATGGLEAMPLTLLLFCGYERLSGDPDRSRGVQAGIFLALAALVRADGFVWAGMILGAGLPLAWFRRDRASRVRSLLVAGGIVAAVVLAHMVWRRVTYGTWLPNTARAKAGFSPHRLRRGYEYGASFLLTLPTLALVLLASTRRWKPGRAHLWFPAVVVVLGGFAYTTYVGGDFMPMGRYLLPVVPFVVVLFADLCSGARPVRTLALGAVAVVLNLLACYDVQVVPRSWQARFHFREDRQWESEIAKLRRMRRRNEERSADAQILARFVEPGESIILGAIGAAGFYSGLDVYDMYGLVSPSVFDVSVPIEDASPGHDRKVGFEHFFPERPTYLGFRIVPHDYPLGEGLPLKLGGLPFEGLVEIDRQPLEDGRELRLLRFRWADADEGSLGPWFTDLSPIAFVGHKKGAGPVAFDVVTADTDGDGDPDLLVNWHHKKPTELFENRDGTFHLIPTVDSGLYDNPGVPDLFATETEMAERLESATEPGLYVWHDVDRDGWWRFSWRPGSGGSASLALSTSLEFARVTGLRPQVRTQPKTNRFEVELSIPHEFRVRTWLPGHVLEIDLRRGDRSVPVFVGPTAARADDGPVELWMNDPHGMAWVDVEGDARPELAITRGGLGGNLVAPMTPKRDQYFRPSPDEDTVYRNVSKELMPAEWGRGRRVEWVQADGDPALELSISRKATPNGLLDRQPSGRLDDVASGLGLAFVDGEALAWADHDGDGRDDVFVVVESRIDVLIQTASGPYRRIDGRDLGLDLGANDGSSRVIDRTALSWVDLDADGHLDLLLTGEGEEAAVRLFRRAGDRYVDVTAEAGLDAAAGHDVVVPIDIDGDRYTDLVTLGEELLVWRNLSGERFAPRGVDLRLDPEGFGAASVADVDGDGREDVIAVGRERMFLRNVAGVEPDWLDVDLTAADGPTAIGALVTAHYDDGTRLAQRLGSAHATVFSQTARPLRFPIPADRKLERVTVRWPGDPEHREQQLPKDGRTLRPRR